MKKLFTLVMAFAALLSANAQSDFTVGENVAAKLGLGDVDGKSFSGATSANSDTNRPHDKVVETLGDYWKVDGDLPNEFLEAFDDNIGIYGFYDKKEADMYQVVLFPAGSYTVDVQALYREGTPADNFTNHFNKKYMKYGHLYADCLSSSDPASTVTRNFDKVLCSLATADQHECVYTYGDGSWMNDYEYTYTDKETGVSTKYYCPQCLVGLSKYFALDKYHNTMRIVVTEPTYIRLGFRKTGSITADWLVFSNLQVIYNGEADETQQMELAKEEAAAAMSDLEDIQNDISNAGFEGLAGAISDILLNSQDAIDEGKTVNDIVTVKDAILKDVDNYSSCLQFVKNLSALLSQCEAMLVSTEFPGYDTFKAAYDAADKAAKTDNVEDLGDDPSAYYQKVYDSLSKDRADYLNSQVADEKGAKDFTSLIKTPWFVNPEYTPTHNDDGTWTLSESTWQWGSVGNPGSYSSKLDGTRTDISSDVVLYPSDDVTNEWYKANRYQSGWSAGVGLMYQSGLIGVSDGWNSLSVGTIGIEQALVGLPNGYYSLKALVRGQNGDVAWDGKNREIYAGNSSGEYVYSETVKNDSDRPNSTTNGWYEWNPKAWTEVETSIISAKDGKLIIGGRCSKVANFTGFRLFFYGENLDFSAKIQEYLDNIAPSVEALLFAGDKKQANALLAEIQLPIADQSAYETAYAQYCVAKEYVAKAAAGEANYNALTTLIDYDSYTFVQPAITYAMTLGESEDDTYEKVDVTNAIANAYKSYVAMYDKCTALNNESINAIVKTQTDAMTAEMKDEATVKAYIAALELPYNLVLMENKGAATATEANPVSLTEFIVNPTFTDNPSNGWSGETPSNNEYAYDENGYKTDAELWNKSAFTLSQTISGLPAGTYELRAKAIYRDGGSVTQDLVDAYNKAGNEEAWANHNAVLFAQTGDENVSSTYIKAIESLKYTTNSFTEVATAFNTEEQMDGSIVNFPSTAVALAGTEKTYESCTYSDDVNEGSYPFDTKVGDYYYPSSMQGFYQVCKNHPEDVTNKVQITINSGDDLTIGIKKTAAISSDWVIFDDFELYYLSGDTFKQVATGIATVNAKANAGSAVYSITGQRVNSSFKGIVIENGKKVIKK